MLPDAIQQQGNAPFVAYGEGVKTKNQVTTTVSDAPSHNPLTFAYISVTMYQVLGSSRRTANEFFWVQIFHLVNQSGVFL